jgi:hypothetical protein
MFECPTHLEVAKFRTPKPVKKQGGRIALSHTPLIPLSAGRITARLCDYGADVRVFTDMTEAKAIRFSTRPACKPPQEISTLRPHQR